MNNGTMTDRNKQIALRCIEEVWNKGREELVEELIDLGFFRHHERNQDEDLHGRDAFRSWLSSVRATIPDIRLTVEHIFAENDRVMMYVSGRGTYQNEAESTSQALTWTTTAIVRLADSRIAECWVISDTLGVLQQLGTVQRLS